MRLQRECNRRQSRFDRDSRHGFFYQAPVGLFADAPVRAVEPAACAAGTGVRMTTKLRIVAGFVVMVILLGVVVFLGYSGINASSDGFSEYRRLARMNIAMSDMETALRGASSELYQFVTSKNAADAEEIGTHLEKAVEQLAVIAEFGVQDSTQAMAKGLRESIDTFGKLTQQVRNSLTENQTQYTSVVLPSALKIIASLGDMTEQALSVNNSAALGRISALWAKVASLLSSVGRFANTYAANDAATVRGYLGEAETALGSLQAVLTTETGRRVFGELDKSFTDLRTAFVNMEKLSTTTRENLSAAASFLNETVERTAAFNSDVNANMLKYGAETDESNASTQKQMAITGAAGLLIGLLIALVIVFGIVRVLNRLSAFAGAIARGEFDHQVAIREKGEIGSMITAMREIPQVLEKVIETAQDLSNGIRTGKLRERMDPRLLPGAFARLGAAVNTVSDAYTELIDALPIPVGCSDREQKRVFGNKAMHALVGDEFTGARCSESMCGDFCNGPQCVGKKSMESGRPNSGETILHPLGKQVHVNLTAFPMLDNSGKVAGYTEIIVDITEIRTKEAAMMDVARKASDISDRVAAASEELAAQVEQISQGAEMQRSRVESTASAMAQMNATVLEVARNAGMASEQTDGMRHKAEGGADLVHKMVDSVNEVSRVGGQLEKNMQDLGTQAESIGGVMNVISDIADQTNLLALNAAIEAARAGEAGRGFAVVADEVRKLAEKTMEATREVGDNISAIQRATRVNMDEVGNAVLRVGEAASLANESGNALREIVDIASSSSAVVASIATAAEQQSATSEEINHAVDEINRIVGETSDGMIQSSEAVQELSRMAQELRHVMESLR